MCSPCCNNHYARIPLVNLSNPDERVNERLNQVKRGIEQIKNLIRESCKPDSYLLSQVELIITALDDSRLDECLSLQEIRNILEYDSNSIYLIYHEMIGKLNKVKIIPYPLLNALRDLEEIIFPGKYALISIMTNNDPSSLQQS